MAFFHLLSYRTIFVMIALLREPVDVDGEYSKVLFLFVIYVVSPAKLLLMLLSASTTFLLCFSICMVPARD